MSRKSHPGSKVPISNKSLLIAIAFLMGGAMAFAGQKFEVVSIRQSISDHNVTAGMRGGGGSPCGGNYPQVDPGRLILQNNPLYNLIAWAYGLDCLQAMNTGRISGGPPWVRTDVWVIQALIPEQAALQLPAGLMFPRDLLHGPISDPKLQKMLQDLLAERFKLVLNHVTKELPVYELTVAKAGPKLLHPEGVPCNPGDLRKLKPEDRPCYINFRGNITDLLVRIQDLFDRPLIDKTGLTGNYEFRLNWTFDLTAGPQGNQASRPLEPGGVSLFTALEEQLGLKLQPSKDPVDVFVIDSVQRPAENN